MNLQSSASQWYVLHTRSRFENVVHEALCNKSLDVFLPKLQIRSKRRDRRMMIKVPLFPGYLFVRSDLNANEHIEIVKTVGAVRLVGNRSGPLPVPTDTIASLKILVTGDSTVHTGNRFKRGDLVVVVAGPFTGVTGTFVRYRGKSRVVVNVDALGQYASVDVDEKDVDKLPAIGSSANRLITP